jgi:predicted dehydrogenase
MPADTLRDIDRQGTAMIRFGTLGAAAITPRALIYPCVDEWRASVYAIAARDRARAEAFARYAGIRHVLVDYRQVVEHPKVDAVYNPLPINLHHAWTIKALEAGKHVLCEKSFASNAVEAQDMVRVAAERKLVVMDAFHYRYHPVFIRAKEIVDSGVLGRIDEIRAQFHVPIPQDLDDIRMNYHTGGGVTMDIGCYPISWVRHLTGEEPVEVSASAEVGPPHVDVTLEATLRFPSGIVARTSGDIRETTKFKAEFEVVGEHGSLTVVNPLVPQNGHQIRLATKTGTTTETRDRRPTYGYQLDAFIAAVETGAPLFTDGTDAVKQMRVIDRCYRAAGLPLRGDPDVDR